MPYDYGVTPRVFRAAEERVAGTRAALFGAPHRDRAESAIRTAERLLRNAGARAKVVRLAPEWKPGDVVIVRFEPGGQRYTYVRGRSSWPGEHVSKSDEQIDALYLDGKVQPVLQSGGEPFDEGRL